MNNDLLKIMSNLAALILYYYYFVVVMTNASSYNTTIVIKINSANGEDGFNQILVSLKIRYFVRYIVGQDYTLLHV